MRKLTKKQKNVIERELKKNPNIYGWDDLSYEVQSELRNINDTEILWMESDRYIHDIK